MCLCALPPPPTNLRKVIIAKNIAETSLTIDKIKYVIDAGLEAISIYDSNTRPAENPAPRPLGKKKSSLMMDQDLGAFGEGVCLGL